MLFAGCFPSLCSPFHSTLFVATFTVRHKKERQFWQWANQTLGGTSSHSLTHLAAHGQFHSHSQSPSSSSSSSTTVFYYVDSTPFTASDNQAPNKSDANSRELAHTVLFSCLYSSRNQFGLDLIKISASIAFSQFVCVCVSLCNLIRMLPKKERERRKGEESKERQQS